MVRPKYLPGLFSAIPLSRELALEWRLVTHVAQTVRWHSKASEANGIVLSGC